MITIDLPPQAETQLQQAAKETGQSAEEWAREIILSYLEDLEDIRDAQAVLNDIEAGRQKTIPLDDLIKEYGLDN